MNEKQKRRIEKQIDRLAGNEARIALYYLLYWEAVETAHVKRALKVATKPIKASVRFASQLAKLDDIPVQ